jgi:CheY-like chemotaxis protein
MIDLTGKKILVVEDEEMNFIYLKQLFKLTKGDFHRVKTGLSAISACKELVFDFVLMDIQLPDISGLEATKEIRKFNKTIPIIAQTACRTPDELEKVIKSGCNDVLIKPFKITDFSSIIEKYIN